MEPERIENVAKSILTRTDRIHHLNIYAFEGQLLKLPLESIRCSTKMQGTIQPFLGNKVHAA
jgi:hypothetical protein